MNNVFKCSSILTGLLLFANLIAAAQSAIYRALQKGDTVPDQELIFSVDNKRGKARLHELNQKLVLLDFWNTTCSSCIIQMPHMLELQETFGREIEIFVVTKNRKKDVESLIQKLEKRTSGKKIAHAFKNLKLITDDSLLSSLFSPPGVPTHVWIDAQKKLYATTYNSTTTQENIQAFLSGKQPRLAEMGRRVVNRQDPLSWLNRDTGFLSRLKSYSFIFSRIEHSGNQDRSVLAEKDSVTGKVIGLNIFNATLTDLYKLAFFGHQQSYTYSYATIPIANNKLLLETNKKDRFYFTGRESDSFDWADKNLYCYAIKVDIQHSDDIYAFMRQELDRYFHLKSNLENRKVKCLVLKRNNQNEKFKASIREEKHEFVLEAGEMQLKMRNQPMALLNDAITYVIAFHEPFRPFVNETGFEGNIDIQLPWDENIANISIDMIRKELERFGLSLQEEYRTLPMLVIEDANE